MRATSIDGVRSLEHTQYAWNSQLYRCQRRTPPRCNGNTAAFLSPLRVLVRALLLLLCNDADGRQLNTCLAHVVVARLRRSLGSSDNRRAAPPPRRRRSRHTQQGDCARPKCHRCRRPIQKARALVVVARSCALSGLVLGRSGSRSRRRRASRRDSEFRDGRQKDVRASIAWSSSSNTDHSADEAGHHLRLDARQVCCRGSHPRSECKRRIFNARPTVVLHACHVVSSIRCRIGGINHHQHGTAYRGCADVNE